MKDEEIPAPPIIGYDIAGGPDKTVYRCVVCGFQCEGRIVARQHRGRCGTGGRGGDDCMSTRDKTSSSGLLKGKQDDDLTRVDRE